MMMKKKFVAVALSAVCLLSAVGCGQQSASTASSASSVSSSVASSASASQVMDAEDYLSGISGTYVELFPEMAKSEYRNLWIDAATPLVGEDNAESATDMLLGMCMPEPYGEEAVEKYAADPDSTAFNCYFLGGVEKFVMNGTPSPVWMRKDRKCLHTPTRNWMWTMKTASSSTRARMRIPGSLPTLPLRPIRWKRRIIWNSAMQRISTTCRAGMKEIMLIGMLPPSQRTMIRQLWKMSLNFSSRKICLRQNKRHMRTRSCQAVRMAILR